MVKAEDLIPLEDDVGMNDLGSRLSRGGPNGQAMGRNVIPGLDLVDTDVVLRYDDLEVPDEDLTGVMVEPDDAGLELELALERSRRLKARKERSNLMERVRQQPSVAQEMSPIKGQNPNITLNATSEFCRSLGEIPTYGQAGNRDEDADELLDFERELIEERRRLAELDPGQSGWQAVDIDTRPVDLKQGLKESVLDEEPVANVGLAGALMLAQRKGYLQKEVKKAATVPKMEHLQAQHYSIEDKRYDDLDDKYRKRERYTGGAVSTFAEKDGYKPEVKLEYLDDGGRNMTPKEAFRYLSHRFHGKGSGKKKQEKRAKKLDEEELMKSMSSTDTPLGTVALLQEKQAAEKTPYIVLSGAGRNQGHGLTK